MNKLSQKIHDLEDSVVSLDVTEESCFIDVSNIPKAEKELHLKAQNLSHKTLNYLTPNERELIEKSCQLLTLRCFLLFRKMIKGLYHFGNYDSLFDTRLMWFLSETQKLAYQNSLIEKLEQENKELNEVQLEEKRINLEFTFEDTFTEKSFDEYENEFWKRLLSKQSTNNAK